MIVVCGDALIDFIPVGSETGRAAYLPLIGGSCLNIAVALGRLGVPVGFMGGISSDMFGNQLAAGLAAAGVSTELVFRSARETTLAFVKVDQGEPQYVFYDAGTAARMWRRTDSPPLGSDVTLLHVGSVTLIAAPVADECLAMLKAEKGRRLLSVDPNCRPTLISDEAAYRDRMRRILALADIIRLSSVDLAYLEPGVDEAVAVAGWLAAGARLVVVTHGAEGATAHGRFGKVSVAAQKTELADTVGAGDTFFAGFLTSLSEAGFLSLDTIDALDRATLVEALAFGAKTSAINCARYGADPPWKHEIV